MNALSIVKKSTQTFISETREHTFTTQEIELTRGALNEMFVGTRKHLMQHIHSVHPVSHPDLFKIIEIENENEVSDIDYVVSEHKYVNQNDGTKRKMFKKYRFVSEFSNIVHENNVLDRRNKHNKKCVGLVNNEQNLLDVVRFHVSRGEAEDDNADNITLEESAPNLTNMTLEEYLKSGSCSLLENILNELKNVNQDKRSLKSTDDLYPELLTSRDSLMADLTVKELQVISQELWYITGRTWHTSNMLKSEIVNSVVKGFGGEIVTTSNSTRCKKTCFNAENLMQICTNAIKLTSFPVQHLQIPLASLRVVQERTDWCLSASVPLSATVPGKECGVQEYIEYFSYPNVNEERNQLEFQTFNFTHILTNLQTQILTRGLELCHKVHFEHLSKNRPDILSLALVFDRTDQQNVFTAMRMFNYDVEHYMHENHFDDMVNFIYLVREWHDACNRRGIPADDRVSALKRMHKFLMKGINFNCVPFQYPGRYIKGLTWQTFEAILQSISMHIQLYYYTKDGTYNARAVSTLSNL